MLETYAMLAALTHRRAIDPITFAKRVRPFVIERAIPTAVGSPDPQGHVAPVSASIRTDGAGGKGAL